MTSELKCPFCQIELESVYVENRPVLACRNLNCTGYFMYAPKELWQELIYTRKVLDVANKKLQHCVNITVEELNELKGNLLIAYNALLHFSKDPIANNALKKITAPKQEDVK